MSQTRHCVVQPAACSSRKRSEPKGRVRSRRRSPPPAWGPCSPSASPSSWARERANSCSLRTDP
eukprot:1179770-Pyramimonas_sp.AAC.1